MTAILEAVDDLPVTRISRWCFNCYVVAGATTDVVVDAFMPRIIDDLTPILGRSVSIAATHAHPDHISGAPAIATSYNAGVHVSPTTMTYLDDSAEPRTPSTAKLLRTWPLLFGQRFDVTAARGFISAASTAGFGTRRGMLWDGAHPVGDLEDGSPLPGAPDWTVIATPGHTDDSVAFWHDASRTLMSGDAVITMRGQPRFAPDTIDSAAAATTITRLKALPVEQLLPGHGLPIRATRLFDFA